jgi:hypothetical protein
MLASHDRRNVARSRNSPSSLRAPRRHRRRDQAARLLAAWRPAAAARRPGSARPPSARPRRRRAGRRYPLPALTAPGTTCRITAPGRRARSLVPDQTAGIFRFGTRSWPRRSRRSSWRARGCTHGSPELSRTRLAASPAELAPHWAAAGCGAEALAASVEAARQAAALFGPTEAVAHLERALALWATVPGAARLAGLDLAGLCSWASELASQTGASPRAVELAGKAIELVGEKDPPRAALLHVRLRVYSYATGSNDAGLAAFERAVELVPAQPPSPERAQALAALGTGLQMAWRHESHRDRQRRSRSRARSGRPAELRALTVLGSNLAYLGRGDQGPLGSRRPCGSRAKR